MEIALLRVMKVLEKAAKSLIGLKINENKKTILFMNQVTLMKMFKLERDTKVWHFSHIQSGSVIGKDSSLGQNVNIGNNVKIGDNVKIQNNVSVYEGVELEDYVFCGPSMVFTNILNPRSEFPQRGSSFTRKPCKKISIYWRKCHNNLW